MARGDAWQVEHRHYDRLRTDCEALGVGGAYFSITLALRRAFEEITIEVLRERNDPSYAGLDPGQTLYEAIWDSPSLQKRLYLKFSLFCRGVGNLHFP